MRTATNKTVDFFTNFTLFADYTVSFWFQLEKLPNFNENFPIFTFATAVITIT